MKLLELTLNNFRQYIGPNKVAFAADANGHNVTLIWGANGLGKTGLFRAVIFALYGERSLDQDGLPESEREKGLILVNEKLLEESIGNQVEANVELKFSHNDSVFTVKRNIAAIMVADDKRIVQENRGVALEEVDRYGNTKPVQTNPEIIEATIERALPRRIRDFFLFDGERMERLTRYGPAQRDEVRKGIRSLLQIDALENAVSGLKKVERDLTTKIRDTSSGEMEAVSEKLEEIQEKIATKEKKAEDCKAELASIDRREKQLETDLEQEKQHEKHLERRKTLKGEREQAISKLEKNKEDLRELLSSSGVIVGRQVIAALDDELRRKIYKGELPTGIRESFVRYLIDSGKCICGESIAHNSEKHKTLANYMSEWIEPWTDAAYQLTGHLSKLSERANGLVQRVEQAATDNLNIKQSIEEKEKQLIRLNVQLQGIEETKGLGEELEKLRNGRAEQNKSLGALEVELRNLNSDAQGLKEKQSILGQKDEISRKYIAQREKVSESITALESIQEHYTQDVRRKLAEGATEVFKRLADERTLKSLARISIDESFQLDVLNKQGNGFLAQISSGQRQIVSLAYICALIQVGGLQLPLFMDTPLGRLSGAHRDGCLRTVPDVTPQWIMLGTDTEIQKAEVEALRQSEKWGEIFEIKAIGDRESRITRHEVFNWVPERSTK